MSDDVERVRDALLTAPIFEWPERVLAAIRAASAATYPGYGYGSAVLDAALAALTDHPGGTDT